MSLNARAGEEEQKGGDRRRIIEIPKDLERLSFVMLTPNLSLKFQPEVWPRVTNPPNPVLSPQFADLRGMTPTFFLTSVRDLLLSGTVNLHRAFVQAGVDAQLIGFDGLPRAFLDQLHVAGIG